MDERNTDVSMNCNNFGKTYLIIVNMMNKWK